MLLSKPASFLLTSAALVAGHGYVTSIEVDGKAYGGYLVDTYYYESNPPDLIAWSTTATDDGYVSPADYAESDIICHRGSAPGALSAPVAPGGSVKMTWSTWPEDHHGPVISYLAKCDGDCADVDKTTLEFFKFDAGSLISDSSIPGTWATDQLIKDSYSRTMTIPSGLEAGNYVLRHEIIALHSAENKDGAQNYPQCINLKVTGSGTARPSGTLGTALYKDTDPGIYVNIWNTLSSYTIPGPALYTAGSSVTASEAAITATSAQSTAADETASGPTTLATTSRAEPSESAQASEAVVVVTTDATSSANTPTATSTSGVLSGSCSQEGYWYCNGGTAFQRCVNGEWDASQSVAAGTQCTAGVSEGLAISATKKCREFSHLRRHVARNNRVRA
ncbi:hypothetical protein N7532_011358 [Penicillium argentinense]|uniref:Auxiliary Activity family 9 catalytic domain-containing protein n=1 Tax=Penicillium argentinense TaxID=1131581 RepID=A0A9W9EIH0_9EURO|nr:uncharacterized protein N7532_011358 [Penicillium argentinense]KAJ5082315.1 hypothetical protein N7532_011358 [Penicillium argentinense]